LAPLPIVTWVIWVVVHVPSLQNVPPVESVLSATVVAPFELAVLLFPFLSATVTFAEQAPAAWDNAAEENMSLGLMLSVEAAEVLFA
jgi:hypothetical protein